MLLILLKLAGLALTVASCWLASLSPAHSALSLALIWVAPLFTIPLSIAGRKSLDAAPTKERAEWATVIVHYGIGIALGAGILPAVLAAQRSSGIGVPFPRRLGYTLFIAASIVLSLTVVNLAVRGFGAPFAAKLSSRLATEWMYAWTRNPMGLATFAWFFSIGLRYQSLWFLIWLVLIVTPAWVFFVKTYEERELEIRFGSGYLAYKARTPLFWPRRPRSVTMPQPR